MDIAINAGLYQPRISTHGAMAELDKQLSKRKAKKRAKKRKK